MKMYNREWKFTIREKETHSASSGQARSTRPDGFDKLTTGESGLAPFDGLRTVQGDPKGQEAGL